MRAVVLDRYGDANELTVREAPEPSCGDHQVIIGVRAAGINPIDWRIRSGSLRFLLPAKFPVILGFDVAGEIVETGSVAKNKGWNVGDHVFCFLDSNRHGGGYAELAVASADVIVRKPDAISFEQAAAVPLAALTALQALGDLGRISAGNEVLVNGASGGVGTFAVQLGRAYGANVTGVCSTDNLEFVRDLGAERIVDYTREDITLQQQKFDIVFDAVGKSSYWKSRRVLKAGGCYITTLPSASSFFFQFTTRFIGPRCRNILARPSGKDLRQIAQLIDEGKIRSIVQEVYRMDQAADAHLASEAGHVRGKLVLKIP